MSTWSTILLSYITKKYPITDENINDIKELTLDYQIIKQINQETKNYIEKFKNIEKFNMSSCKLISLENLPKLPNLIKIELNDNFLTEKDLVKLSQYPQLSEIYVAKNHISSFEELKSLSNMRDLHLLDLSDNPICQKNMYRETMFKIFPKLLFLDGVGKNNEKYEEFREENEEEEEEEDENEEDKDFISYEEVLKNKSDDESKDSEEEENEEDENINEEEEEEDEEIENPNPAKKKKLK